MGSLDKKTLVRKWTKKDDIELIYPYKLRELSIDIENAKDRKALANYRLQAKAAGVLYKEGKEVKDWLLKKIKQREDELKHLTYLAGKWTEEHGGVAREKAIKDKEKEQLWDMRRR